MESAHVYFSTDRTFEAIAFFIIFFFEFIKTLNTNNMFLFATYRKPLVNLFKTNGTNKIGFNNIFFFIKFLYSLWRHFVQNNLCLPLGRKQLIKSVCEHNLKKEKNNLLPHYHISDFSRWALALGFGRCFTIRSKS